MRVVWDKYLMHSTGRYAAFYGWLGSGNFNPEMITIIGDRPNQAHPISPREVNHFQVRKPCTRHEEVAEADHGLCDSEIKCRLGQIKRLFGF